MMGNFIMIIEENNKIFCEKRGQKVESCISIKFCDHEECQFKRS